MDSNINVIKTGYFLQRYMVLLLTVGSMLVGTVRAQTASAVKPGNSTGSFALSDFESINPYSGNLNFSLPLLRVAGRGSASSSLRLTINQRWTGRDYNDANTPPGYNPVPYVDDYYANEFGDNTILDDGYSLGPGKVVVNHIGLYGTQENPCPWNGGVYLYSKTLTTVTFFAPDGTQYAFRDRATNGQPNTIYPCNFNEPSRGTVFDATDGSSATFVSDSAIHDSIYEGSAGPEYDVSGYVVFADGTQFRVANGYVIDRNGNKTMFSSSLQSGKITSLTDALSRQVTIEYDVQDVAPYGLCDRINYKGFDGATRVIRISHKLLSQVLQTGFSMQTHGELFPGVYSPDCDPYRPYLCASHSTDPQKVSTLWLPDGRSYNFKYNSHGELARVELPTGGAIEYDWADGYGMGTGLPNGISPFGDGISRFDVYRRVTERRVYTDGINLESKMTIGGLQYISTNIGSVAEDQYDGNNNLLARTVHYYYGVTSSGNYVQYDGFYESWMNGREYQTDSIDSDGTTVLRRTTSIWVQASPSWYTGSSTDAPNNNPHVTQTTTLLADSNQMSAKTFTYDTRNHRTDTCEYDYGNGVPGTFLRREHTDYLTTNPVNSIDYTSDSIHILDLPTQTWVSSDSAGNNKVSRTEYEYDNYASDSTHAPLVDRSNITGHDSNYGTSFSARGNVTKVTSYADAQNQTGAVSSYLQYDIAGNVVKTFDAKGNAAIISYNDNFGSPDAEARTNTAPSLLNGQQTFAFPTSATNALGYTAYTQVDYFTGALVDAEDINGNVSTTFYDDPLDRPTQSISANNRPSFRKQSAIVYDDANRKVIVTSDSKSFGDNLIKAESFYDKLGRTTETRSYEAASNYISALTEYDSLGRAYKSSNPFRPYLNEQPEWTTTSFDALGRVIQVKTPDNAIVSQSYNGTTTTVTDQAGRKRSGTTDAIGRLLRVNEDPNGLNYQTDYIYDVVGRLRKTTQTDGGTTQNRYFMYDDLGRLIRARQVEQRVNSAINITDPVTGNTGWSVAYAFDNNGNITATTDALNRTITGTYDDLNRLTSRTYSDGTPSVSFAFDDPNVANSKGKLTTAISSVSATYYTSFDEIGRVKSSQQITNGQTYNFPDYTYDLSGALVSQTYPSGRIVTVESDNIGRLSKLTSFSPNQAPTTYLGNVSYTASGAVQSDRLGNGRWETTEYDPNRLQITQVGLGGSAGDTSLSKIEYSYGTSDNNGALLQQKITVPGAANQIVQDYSYDSLNRLQSATETVNSFQTWKQTFSIDRFGNRRFDSDPVKTSTLGSCAQAVCNPNIDQAKNQLSATDRYTFDNEGNLTVDLEDHGFAYDGENRIKEVQDTANQITSDYQYDGLGKRVRKTVGTEETVFVYDAFGKLVTEYASQAPQNPQIAYLSADSLGSPRVVTNALGQVISRHDYMPYGEEVTAGVGGRTTAQGYGENDGVRQQFAGYEKDDESGLDYAQARYFKPSHGRFTSVDPLPASANIKNPQSLNRYSYALNSPYKFADPLGMRPCAPGASAEETFGPACDTAGDLAHGSESSQTWDALEEDARLAGVVDDINDAVHDGNQDKARRLCDENQGVVCTVQQNDNVMSPSESWMAQAFGDPGAYVSNPNDGDPIDRTTGGSMSRGPDDTNNPENHMYGSSTDPDARTNFYIPAGGVYLGSNTYTETGGGKSSYALIYFKELGGLRNVTIAVFHMVNIKLGPVQSDGRRKLGEMGPGMGGEWHFLSRDSSGRLKSTLSYHFHLEIYTGKHIQLPKPGHKPFTNFNGVVN